MSIKPQNPSLDTIILTWGLALRQETVALREKLLNSAIRKLGQAQDAADDAQDRLDWSIRQDLDDEADDLRAVISDCNKAKAQAEARLTSILQYLDPDEFYAPPPQVPLGAEPAADEKIIDEDDAPEGYKAVPWDADTCCRGCSFEGATCPECDEELRCSASNRPDQREVRFVPRT